MLVAGLGYALKTGVQSYRVPRAPELFKAPRTSLLLKPRGALLSLMALPAGITPFSRSQGVCATG